MQRLSIADIRSIVATAPPKPPPTFKPTEATVGPYGCPVCLEFQLGTTLLHAGCMKAVCAQCLLAHLDLSKPCPYCRGELLDATWSETSLTAILRPTPNDQFWLEKVEFTCDNCLESMLPVAAFNHRTVCIMEPRHRPPAHINPWHQSAEATREVVSNPPANSTGTRWNQHYLFIYHFNGRQLATRFVKKTKTCSFVRGQLADIARVDRDDIKIYKFIHREVPDNEIVSTFANPIGATYLAAFNNLEAFGGLSIQMSLLEIGEPLYIAPPRPVTPPRRQQHQQQHQQQEADQEWW